MEVNARISTEWRKRMLFMFFMIFGIAAWFLSDGYYFWPNEDKRFDEYNEILDGLVEAGKAADTESSSVQIAWQRHAREQGYKSKVPKERTDSAIGEQRVIVHEQESSTESLHVVAPGLEHTDNGLVGDGTPRRPTMWRGRGQSAAPQRQQKLVCCAQ